MIEWEDSAIGLHGWQAVSDLAAKPSVCRIASVGWIVKRTKKALTLAQNVGGLDGKAMGQVRISSISLPRASSLSRF